MSTDTTANKKAANRQTPRHFNVDHGAVTKPAVINKIDVTALQIDETHSDGCDPYNSTGLHLIDAAKAQRSD